MVRRLVADLPENAQSFFWIFAPTTLRNWNGRGGRGVMVALSSCGVLLSNTKTISQESSALWPCQPRP